MELLDLIGIMLNKIILADIFILCAGAIETPRIILQSNYKKISNKYNYVGKGINDHYKGVLGHIKIDHKVSVIDLPLNKKINAGLKL